MQNQKYRVVTNGEEFAVQVRKNYNFFFFKKEVWQNITIGFDDTMTRPTELKDFEVGHGVYSKEWTSGPQEIAELYCRKLNKQWEEKNKKPAPWRPV